MRRMCVVDNYWWAGKKVQPSSGCFRIYMASQRLRSILPVTFPNLQTKNQAERLHLVCTSHDAE